MIMTNNNRIKSSIAFLIFAILYGFLGHAQQRCYQIKADFTDPTASEEQKNTTIRTIGKRLEKMQMEAEIWLENGNIVARMPCEEQDKAMKCFHQDKFAIYETYKAEELDAAIEGLRDINDSVTSNAYGPSFDQMLDRDFTGGASIGSCPIKYTYQFTRLVSLPESRELLPADLSFVFGVAEKDGLSVPVYAIKKQEKPSITIDMIKEAGVERSFDGDHYDVMLDFKKEYKATWEALTTKNTQKFLTIMLDDRALICAMVTAPIKNAKTVVSMRMGLEEAKAMAERINMSLALKVLITEVKML
jgi:hypothetical protein